MREEPFHGKEILSPLKAIAASSANKRKMFY